MPMMVLLAAAALAATPPQPRPAAAVAQATATIRIVAAVTLKLDGSVHTGAPRPRECIVRMADGTTQRAKLIEFQ
jgi:hypothetical protein